MSKFLMPIILTAAIFQSCQDKCEIKKSVDELLKEKTQIQANIHQLNNEKKVLTENVNELHILSSGTQPKYHIQLHFSPTTLRLTNIAVNTFDIELTVDKTFYDSHYENEMYGRMRIVKKWLSK